MRQRPINIGYSRTHPFPYPDSSVIPGKNQHEELLHFRASTVKLPKAWNFCRLRRHVNFQPGDRRNPAWSALVEELERDFQKNPTDEDFFPRIERILADPNSLKNIRTR
jgi:hypothetical protein